LNLNNGHEWDSNPHPMIFDHILRPMSYRGLFRSFSEGQPKLFSALINIIGVIVDPALLGTSNSKRSDSSSFFEVMLYKCQCGARQIISN